VAYERFKEARQQKRPEAELRQHLNTALKYYTDALNLFPPNAVNELAVTHKQLGDIWSDAGQIERALQHYTEGIRYAEAAQNFQGRFHEARLYAEAALRGFARYGAGAAEEVERTKGLLAEIESLASRTRSS
jgi:tetratricopeptide (TPR) repeat protein